MGERYYITGVQLGMFMAYFELGKFEEAKALLLKIEDQQFVGSLDLETQTLEIVPYSDELGDKNQK